MDKKKTLTVVKLGSHILSNPSELDHALHVFTKLPQPKILVHGGGSQATLLANQLGVETKMLDGRRITSEENLKVVTMVYAGLINTEITSSLQGKGCNAIGLSGADGNCIQSEKRTPQPVDFGYVGDINQVNAEQIFTFLEMGLIPVFCSITNSKSVGLLNTNGDSIAAEIAIAMTSYYKTKLFYCFEKNGVLKEIDDNSSVISKITCDIFNRLKEENVIYSGMLPKIDNCFYALKNQVNQVCIGQPLSMLSNGENCTTLTLE